MRDISASPYGYMQTVHLLLQVTPPIIAQFVKMSIAENLFSNFFYANPDLPANNMKMPTGCLFLFSNFEHLTLQPFLAQTGKKIGVNARLSQVIQYALSNI